MKKTGKVSQAVLDRSVLRPLSKAGVLQEKGPAFGKDWGNPSAEQRVFPIGEGEPKHRNTRTASVCGTLGGSCDRDERMFLATVVNNLAVAGAKTESMMLTLLFPSDREEEELKRILEKTGAWCAAQQIVVAGGHTEVSGAVSRPVLSVTGFGTVQRDMNEQTEGLKPRQDLVMAGWAGMAGTAILAGNREQELAERYPFSIIDAARELGDRILITDAAREGAAFGVSAMHYVSQGGIFAALWEMAEYGGVGLEVDLKKIPIRQETIEICEFFDLNPYQLYGQGALLMGTSRGEALAQHLSSRGIPAALIGHTTAENDRILRNGEDMRYLDRPAQDALWVLSDRNNSS